MGYFLPKLVDVCEVAAPLNRVDAVLDEINAIRERTGHKFVVHSCPCGREPKGLHILIELTAYHLPLSVMEAEFAIPLRKVVLNG